MGIWFVPKPVAYLAGPMSGYPDFNRPAFHTAAESLRKLGFTVINPAELDNALPLSAKAPYTDFYRRDLPYLARSELVVALPGWEKSTGATHEVSIMANLLQGKVLSFPSMRKIPKTKIPKLVFAS